MSQFLELFLTFLIILNPLGAMLVSNSLKAGDGMPGQWAAPLAAALAYVLLGGAVLLGDSLLDLLDLSHSSFQVAVGLLLLLGTARIFVQRDPFAPPPTADKASSSRAAERGDRSEYRLVGLVSTVRLLFWLASPAALAALAFYGADRDEGDALVALGVTVPLVLGAVVCAGPLEHRLKRAPLRELARVIGVMLVVVAVDLILDGIVDV